MGMITLVGGAPVSDAVLETALAMAPLVVAADGGAERVRLAGLVPEAVIGDMDSITPEARAAFADVLDHVAEQATTDFEKCLIRLAKDLDCDVIAVGFSGGRIDHQLSVLNVLTRYAGRRIILLSDDDASRLCPAEITLDLPVGTRLSLMPLGAAACVTTGLRWNLSGQAMAPAGFTSISNEVAGPVTIKATGPLLLVIPSGFVGQL